MSENQRKELLSAIHLCDDDLSKDSIIPKSTDIHLSHMAKAMLRGSHILIAIHHVSTENFSKDPWNWLSISQSEITSYVWLPWVSLRGTYQLCCDSWAGEKQTINEALNKNDHYTLPSPAIWWDHAKMAPFFESISLQIAKKKEI